MAMRLTVRFSGGHAHESEREKRFCNHSKDPEKSLSDFACEPQFTNKEDPVLRSGSLNEDAWRCVEKRIVRMEGDLNETLRKNNIDSRLVDTSFGYPDDSEHEVVIYHPWGLRCSRIPVGGLCIDPKGRAWEKTGRNEWNSFHADFHGPIAGVPLIQASNYGMELLDPIAVLPEWAKDASKGDIELGKNGGRPLAQDYQISNEELQQHCD